jgi:ribosome biogenesis protein MAK21
MPKVEGDDDDLLEDSDEGDLPSNFGDSDKVDVSENENDDNGGEGEGDTDDGLSMAEDSDNEDLISLDGDIPHGLIEYDGSDADDTGGDDDDDVPTLAKDEEWGGISNGDDKKRKRENDNTVNRKKLRSLPTFASYEDYAKLIEEGLEDDI